MTAAMIPFAEVSLTVARGCQSQLVLQPTLSERGYRPVSAVSLTAPVRLTVPDHGLPNGWTVKPIGTGNSPLLRLGEKLVTVIDGDTLEINDTHALDWPEYTGGVQLAYLKPLPLHGYTARFEVRASASSPSPILVLESPDHIAVEDGAVRLTLGSAHTQEVTAEAMIYRLTLRAPGSDDDQLLAHGRLTLLPWAEAV